MKHSLERQTNDFFDCYLNEMNYMMLARVSKIQFFGHLMAAIRLRMNGTAHSEEVFHNRVRELKNNTIKFIKNNKIKSLEEMTEAEFVLFKLVILK